MVFGRLSRWGDFSYGASRERELKSLTEPDLVKALAYWRKVTPPGAFAPAWGQFRLQDLPAAAISQTLVVDVLGDPPDFRYRFWGTAHAERKKIDRTGQKTSEEHPQGRGPLVAREYAAVVERREPVLFSRLIEFPDGRLPLAQIALRLPLSDGGDRVAMVVSVTHWDETGKRTGSTAS